MYTEVFSGKGTSYIQLMGKIDWKEKRGERIAQIIKKIG